MSSLILCHKKKAKNAYTIAQLHCRIYTIEELCYYLCHHLYLIDYTIMNEQLCDWLDEELDLTELADKLRNLIEKNSSMEQFVLTVLEYSTIYTVAELQQIQGVMERLKNQRPVEKQKYKADSLLETGAVKSAIMVYLDILRSERDESLDGKFYGKVYGSLGAAYGRMFLYEEAAKMYEAAYQICEEKKMLMAYLYACRRYMNQESYCELLNKSAMYREVDQQMMEKVQEAETRVRNLQYDDTLEGWKKEYRRISTGEI